MSDDVKPKSSLTFGVELEFTIKALPDGVHDPEEKDGRPVSGLIGGADGNSTHGIHAKAIHRVTSNNEGLLEKHWTVDWDVSICAPSQSDWYPIEIYSPALSMSEETLRQVETVAKIITETYRAETNNSCGVHVHVGDGGKGLELDAFRNLMAYLWTYESQLSQIHPKHRLESPMCPSMWKATPLGTEQLRFGRYTRKEGLEQIITSTPDWTEMARWMVFSASKTAYDIRNLIRPYKEDYKRTIEFRQHEGTLDPERIVIWIMVCTGLVLYARDKPPAEVLQLCRANIDKGSKEFTLLDVLTPLGLRDCAFHYQMRIEQDKVEPKEQGQRLFAINIKDDRKVGKSKSI